MFGFYLKPRSYAIAYNACASFGIQKNTRFHTIDAAEWYRQTTDIEVLEIDTLCGGIVVFPQANSERKKERKKKAQQSTDLYKLHLYIYGGYIFSHFVCGVCARPRTPIPSHVYYERK